MASLTSESKILDSTHARLALSDARQSKGISGQSRHTHPATYFIFNMNAQNPRNPLCNMTLSQLPAAPDAKLYVQYDADYWSVVSETPYERFANVQMPRWYQRAAVLSARLPLESWASSFLFCRACRKPTSSSEIGFAG